MRVTIERHHNGLTISAIVRGYRVHKLYQGYTRKEAIAKFRSEFL